MCHCERLIKAIDAYIQKADDDLIDALTDEGFVEPKKTVMWASDIEDAVTDILESETEYFLKAAREAVDLEEFAEKIWPGVKLTDGAAEKLAEIFKEQLAEYLPELATPYIQQMDKELTCSTLSKRTTAWVESWSAELSGLMKLSSHEQIERILNKNLEAGTGIQGFITDIQDSGIRTERYRARTTAITESLRAHSVAQEEAIQQSPATESKEWVHTGSYRNEPRENHQRMNGQVVPKDKPFTLYGADGGTYYPMYPRDPSLPAGESINCHCVHRGIVSKEVLGLDLKERKRLQAEIVADMDDKWIKELEAKNRAKAGIE